MQALAPSTRPGGQASILYKHRGSADLDERIEGLLLVVLGDNFSEELVFTLGQFDEGTDTVDVRVDLDVEDVVPPCKGKMPLVYTRSTKIFWERWFWVCTHPCVRTRVIFSPLLPWVCVWESLSTLQEAGKATCSSGNAHQGTTSFQPRDRREVWSSSGIQTKFNQELEHRVLNSGRSEVNYSTSLLAFLGFLISIRHADEELPFGINISGK